ncbi:MAG: universal stress protein [Natrialbaceae archaeon]|nr:universal stress protein [Natrialbaceae archaeon]
MYDRILIPTDGSDASAAAVDHGRAMAEAFGASVNILSVVNEGATRDQLRTDPEDQADNRVSALLERLERDGFEATGHTKHGLAHEAILQYIDDHDIDCVVMGTHGRTGVDRMLIGSVTEEVVREAPVPVMTVHPRE